jgi:D-xylulose reductase
MAGGAIDVKPLITDAFAFEDGVQAFDFAAHMPPTSVKAQIELCA